MGSRLPTPSPGAHGPKQALYKAVNFADPIVMLRIFFLLVAIITFSAPRAVAEGADPTPTSVLIEQAKTALAQKDEETFDTLMNRLFVRITGFDASFSEVPKGVSEDVYIEKMCEYDRVTAPISTPELLAVMRHQTALMAYSVIDEGSEGDVAIRAMAECVHADGRPTAMAQMMHDGIAWAKRLKVADYKETLRMATKKVSLARKHPHIESLALLAKLALYDAQKKQGAKLQNLETRLDKLAHETKKTRTEGIAYQARLVEKAHKGDLAAQMDLARRLETGDKFRQDNAMAYFWYTRALKNGGGEAAQSAMDRLHPLLDAGHLMSIEIWTENNHRPY